MKAVFLFAYNLGILTYGGLVFLVSFFNPKAKKWIAGRHDWENRLAKANLKQPIWFHVPSLGEFEQARPIIESIKKKHPSKNIVLTFFSPSGYEVRKNYEFVDYVCYLPLDTSQNANRFLEIVKPSLVIWTKYDFWFHFLIGLKERKVPAILISSIFRKDQWFFKFYGLFMLQAIGAFNQIYVQDKVSKSLLENAHILNVTVLPDTRFDRVWETAQNPLKIEILDSFKNEKPIFLVGSMWESDEHVILPFIKKYKDQLKFVIAPHEIHPPKIEALKNKIGGAICTFSEPENCLPQESNVFILDTIGLLSSAYAYADYTYIGGGFGVGIHNILEAIVFENMVFIGPKYQKFKEANELVAQEAIFPIRNSIELNTVFEQVGVSEQKSLIKQKLKSYISQNIGSTEFIVKSISEENWL